MPASAIAERRESLRNQEDTEVGNVAGHVDDRILELAARRQRPREGPLLLGDFELGYMVLPASPAVREYLAEPAHKLSVPIDGAVPGPG